MEAEESMSSESLAEEDFLAVFFVKDLMEEEEEAVVVAAEEIMDVDGEEEEEDVDLVIRVERAGLTLSRRELVEILEVGVETDRDGEEMEGERGATTVEEEEEEGGGVTGTMDSSVGSSRLRLGAAGWAAYVDPLGRKLKAGVDSKGAAVGMLVLKEGAMRLVLAAMEEMMAEVTVDIWYCCSRARWCWSLSCWACCCCCCWWCWRCWRRETSVYGIILC